MFQYLPIHLFLDFAVEHNSKLFMENLPFAYFEIKCCYGNTFITSTAILLDMIWLAFRKAANPEALLIFLGYDWLYLLKCKLASALVQRPFPLYVLMHIKVYFVFELLNQIEHHTPAPRTKSLCIWVAHSTSTLQDIPCMWFPSSNNHSSLLSFSNLLSEFS